MLFVVHSPCLCIAPNSVEHSTHEHRGTGTQGHRGTGTQGHRDTGTQGHRDTGTQDTVLALYEFTVQVLVSMQ